jgi:GDPmannose 4,6-dehydratase
MKRALITGVNGQDGSYLAEYLLRLGYEVHGTVRFVDTSTCNLQSVLGRVQLHYADLRDVLSLEKTIRKVNPQEIYNLAGQVFVPTSWSQPAETFDVNVGGLARIMNIVEKAAPEARVYQASSSEMYGNVYNSKPLTEHDRMRPVSPYGASKLAAHKLVDVYRQKGYYVAAGILFNHESPRRGGEMVTRKIACHVGRWAAGDRTELKLGNLFAERDWGFAGDYVKAMHKMLQQPYGDDYVIGTGKAHSVQTFLSKAIEAAGLPQSYNTDYVVSGAAKFARQDELKCLVADYSHAKLTLGWEPETSFDQLVQMMVEAEVSNATVRQHQALCQQNRESGVLTKR